MLDYVEICGWIGSISFALYSIPQALDAIRTGKSRGLSRGTILLLVFGALFSFLYIVPDIKSPLFYNFLGSFICGLTICKYHFFPRRKAKFCKKNLLFRNKRCNLEDNNYLSGW